MLSKHNPFELLINPNIYLSIKCPLHNSILLALNNSDTYIYHFDT